MTASSFQTRNTLPSGVISLGMSREGGAAGFFAVTMGVRLGGADRGIGSATRRGKTFVALRRELAAL
jgi:hypothetical protein